MAAILAVLAALLLLAAVLAATLSALSKATLLALAALAPFVVQHRRRIYVIAKTFKRDLTFLWRYTNGRLRWKRWARAEATVVQLFNERAERNPNAPCFIAGEKTWTFQEMATKSNQVARVLQDLLQLKRGDVVCVLMPNGGEYVWSWLGVAKLGGVSALINTHLRNKSLLHCIQIANPRAIIFADIFAGSIFEIQPELDKMGGLKLLQLGAQTPEASNVIDLAKEMDQQQGSYPFVVDPPRYKDTLLYIYTSGTTGLPKAAIIPNPKYLLVTVATVHMLGLRRSDRMYNPLPLYHTAGGVVGTCAALIDGIPSVLRDKFSASNYFTDCIRHRCTVGQYIGEMCRYLVAQPSRPTDRQHSLRIMVGNGMRPPIWHEIVRRFQIPQINEIYGATEGNANIINVDNKVGAVGFMPSLVPCALHPSAVVRADPLGTPVRGPDGYCIRCKPNELGMFIGLIAQGDASREYYGYVDQKESNKKVIRDVFRKGDAAFVSGDILVMDELGYLYFRDRTGDTYKWKGENVATAEVEDAIAAAVPSVPAIVYGVSVPGAEGRAGMAALADSDQTVDLVRLAAALDDTLPFYARPVFIRFTKHLELTGTFKLKKLQYQKEGFDLETVQDPIFVRCAGTAFQQLTMTLYKDICSGNVKM